MTWHECYRISMLELTSVGRFGQNAREIIPVISWLYHLITYKYDRWRITFAIVDFWRVYPGFCVSAIENSTLWKIESLKFQIFSTKELLESFLMLFRVFRLSKGRFTWGGGPQVGEVNRFGRVNRLSIKSLILIWLRLHDRWGDPPHVTAPIWGPPPPCKQALKRPLMPPWHLLS